MVDVLRTYKDVAIKGMLMIGLVLLGGAAVLYPMYTDIVDLREKVLSTENAIEQQRVFSPVYTDMQERSVAGVEADFKVPDVAPVHVRDIGEVPLQVETFAESAGLKVLDVIISPSSLRQGGGKLMLQAVLSGDLNAYWNFYLQLGSWGAVHRVGRVEVQAAPGGLEFFTEFWVYIQEGAG